MRYGQQNPRNIVEKILKKNEKEDPSTIPLIIAVVNSTLISVILMIVAYCCWRLKRKFWFWKLRHIKPENAASVKNHRNVSSSELIL